MNETHLQYLASADWARRLEADLLPWIERQAPLGNDVLEIGPGPGQTTDILRRRAATVTAVEIDQTQASELAERLSGTNVHVVQGDAAALDFESDRFSAVTAFSVLHHVPTTTAQDQILQEIRRVLTPGGSLFATDARDLEAIRDGHDGDVFNPLPLDSLEARLEAAGLEHIDLEIADYEIRFSARRPVS
jgi:SAM-dependent methyltransferase